MKESGLFNSDKNFPPIPPLKPTLRDFSLSEKSYEEIINKIDKFNKSIIFYKDRYKKLREVYGFIFISISIALSLYINSTSNKYSAFIVAFYTFIIAGLLFVVIEHFLFDYEYWARKRAVKHRIGPSAGELQKLYDYEAAIKKYHQEVDQYEWELSEYNRNIKAKESEYWYSISGWEFENEFASLLNRHGFKTQITSGSSDGGIDIFASKDGIDYAVQCKAHKNPIGPSIARDFYGSMVHNKIKHGILVNLGGFSKSVVDFTNDKTIKLLDINEVIKLHKGEMSI